MPMPLEIVTYSIKAPTATHRRTASCEEVACAHQADGWQTVLDESTDLGLRGAAYIRGAAGRAFTETRNEAALTVFTFPAGQKCFTAHTVPLDREPFYLVGSQYGGTREHTDGDDWVDDMQENLDVIRTIADRG